MPRQGYVLHKHLRSSHSSSTESCGSCLSGLFVQRRSQPLPQKRVIRSKVATTILPNVTAGLSFALIAHSVNTPNGAPTPGQWPRMPPVLSTRGKPPTIPPVLSAREQPPNIPPVLSTNTRPHLVSQVAIPTQVVDSCFSFEDSTFSPGKATRTPKEPVMPEPLASATKVEVATLADVPTTEALTEWLNARGLDTSKWGEGNTKSVKKFWAEINAGESGLELWRSSDGTRLPVRTTHVMRAKVCSPSSYKQNIFLFNTWQQFADGRKRMRNALLSEKLSTSEVPMQEHMHEVCVRAIVEEEMQRLAEATLKIGPQDPAPTYDPSYICPLDVVEEVFVDHVVEVEVSKSYLGLLTIYHLYTVDIICSGLPATNFNTLEFEPADKEGNRKLKYVHAWVWLPWDRIKRYLFDGSKMKERKVKGSFQDADALGDWLSRFDQDLDDWGRGPYKSVDDLYDELEQSKSQLELWDRRDGVPLLMRVVHVINVKVVSTDVRLAGKCLFHVWTQGRDRSIKSVNRLPAKKVSTVDLPFDEERFAKQTNLLIHEKLATLVNSYFYMSNSLPTQDDLLETNIAAERIQFVDHRVDVENSPSFPRMHTVYHLYTMEVELSGLPVADFTVYDTKLKSIHGYHWGAFQEIIDVLHAKVQALQSTCNTQGIAADTIASAASELQRALDAGRTEVDARIVQSLLQQVQDTLLNFPQRRRRGDRDDTSYEDTASLASMLPPAVVSACAERMLVPEAFVESARRRRCEEPFSRQTTEY